jgi:16S rRNA (cytidine1402-2'-O)-methyltransferase
MGLARELTKKFEECLRGTPAQLLAAVQERKLKGEFVVIIGPPDAPRNTAQSSITMPND